jgi:PilZ domain.
MASVGPTTFSPKRTELRSAKRRRVRQPAKIVIGSETMIHCEVHEISEDGARIAVREHWVLPDTFQLYIVAHALQVFTARLCWRSGNFAGVSFREDDMEADCQSPTDSRDGAAGVIDDCPLDTQPIPEARLGAGAVQLGRFGSARRRRSVR